jgi:hypothetical protein
MAKYIDGIFNYCDRWCERCPFTSRCRNFSMGRAMERHAEQREKENQAFWEAMDKACGDALERVKEQADSLTPSESDQEKAEKADYLRHIKQRDKAVRAHPISKLSNEYLKACHKWLTAQGEDVPEPIADAVEVISWYHMFIHVKFARALDGLIDQQDEDYEGLLDDDGVPFPKDCDGSAKIAVIAIERSFAAWSLVRERVEKEKKTAAAMMGMLLRMRSIADQCFPEARKFHRPGFDDVGSRD